MRRAPGGLTLVSRLMSLVPAFPSCFPVWFVEGVAVVAETNAAARRVLWRGELLDEVGHAALDLLDVTLGGIHAPLKLCDALDLVKPIQQHLAKHTRRSALAYARLGSLQNASPAYAADTIAGTACLEMISHGIQQR